VPVVVRLAAGDPAGMSADVLVVGINRDRRDAKLTISPDTGRLIEAITKLEATGKADEVTRLPGFDGFAAPVILCVGLGAAATDVSSEDLRRAAGAALFAVSNGPRVVVAMPGQTPAAVAAAAQGAQLGAYRYDRFRGTGTTETHKAPNRITIAITNPHDRHVREAVRQAGIVADQVCFARDLVNTPPSALHPKELAQAAVDAAIGTPVKAEVMDERALKRGRFGGILAVGQGSVNPPRLVRLTYRPTRPRVHVALVGKGITFDSGGLSIKPAASMETMKCDMGGAAAVIGATLAIARLGIPASVTTYAACAENMPSGTAQRPGDVYVAYGGKTVEVLNTDAEGRLVLADALVRAQEDSPDVIVDVATLTGAQMVALGNRVSAVMANDDELRDDVMRAAGVSGEQFWPMPLPKELRPSLDSPIADIANIGDRMGGMLTAGLFLQEFVEQDQAWAHLDIAGPAFNEGSSHDYTPKGGTGVAVRTLVQLVRDLADDRSA
jgi:leucyl aminopeptidase